MTNTTEEDKELYIESCLQHGIKKSSELHAFLEYSSGLRVPHKQICKNHQTPWNYIENVYFEKSKSIVVIAPRDGGKTQNTALCNYAELALKPQIEIASVGAIQSQANKCYKYTREVFERHSSTDKLIERITKTEMETLLGGEFKQLVGTLSGSNSPHPHKLRVDEVELIKWEILEEMFLMPHSKTSQETGAVIIPSHLALISSMKQAGGNMAILEKNHKEMGFDFLKWCYKEVSQACPVERRGTEKVLTITTDLLTHIQKESEVYEGCVECPLLHTCKGDLARADGYIPVEDNIRIFRQVSVDTWLNQKEARKAGSSLLVYKIDQEDGGKHIGHYPFNPDLPLQCWIDVGGRVETAILFVQFQLPEPGGELPETYIVHEIYEAEKPDEYFHAEINKYCDRIGRRPDMFLVDNAATQFIINLQNAGFYNVQGCYKGGISEGIRRVEGFVETASGETYLHIDRSCEGIIRESTMYQYPNPYAVVPVDRNNHAWDAYRYGVVTNFGLVSNMNSSQGVRFQGGQELTPGSVPRTGQLPYQRKGYLPKRF